MLLFYHKNYIFATHKRIIMVWVALFEQNWYTIYSVVFLIYNTIRCYYACGEKNTGKMLENHIYRVYSAI